MISVFYASLSIIVASVLGLVAGGIIGVRILIRVTGGFEKLVDDPKYRNTAGAIWVLDEVQKRIKNGSSLDEIAHWIDEQGERYVSIFEDPAVGEDLVKAMRADADDDSEGA